ncbi:hypothetical protein U0070_002065, partial [Myodes glareolus]
DRRRTKIMDNGNCSSLPEFLLLGITTNTDMKVVIFTMFLTVYLAILLTNVGMIILIRMDSQLQTPIWAQDVDGHLKIHSAEGKFKAFSTCTSHLTAVAIFQGTLLFTYFQPSSSYSLDQDKLTSLFYTLVIPMLNPLIYSLRKRDVKEALQKLRNKRIDAQLHTPMYFFLSHLSFSDLCSSTAIGPKMLLDLLSKKASISFLGCAVQFFTFCIFIDAECVLLAVMAFDRYKAISKPLLYSVDMSSRVCFQLLTGVYAVALTDALVHTTLTFHLCFCGSNKINHFFCDIPPVLVLSCSDTQVNVLVIFTVFGFIELSTISGVLVSYCYIISSVLKISSASGRLKAFSTCTSHLTAVAIFQGTMLFMYFRPRSSYSLDQDK